MSDSNFIYKVNKNSRYDDVELAIKLALKNFRDRKYEKVDAHVSPGNYKVFDIKNSISDRSVIDFIIRQVIRVGGDGKFENATIAIQPIKNGKNSIFEEVNYFPY